MTLDGKKRSMPKKYVLSLIGALLGALVLAPVCYAYIWSVFQSGNLGAGVTKTSDDRGDWTDLQWWFKDAGVNLRVAWVDQNGNWWGSALVTAAQGSRPFVAGHGPLKALCKNPTTNTYYVNCAAEKV